MKARSSPLNFKNYFHLRHPIIDPLPGTLAEPEIIPPYRGAWRLQPRRRRSLEQALEDDDLPLPEPFWA